MSNEEAQSASSQKADQARQYLRLALSKNPLWESEQLLELRRKAFGISKAVAAPKITHDPQSSKRREAMRRAVDKIQREFWSLPMDDLQRRLAAIDIKQAPDVGGVVKRLRTAALCRGEFPQLASTDGIHLPLVHAFKTAVVLPPSEAGYVREQFLRSINDRKQLQDIKRTIRIIQKEYSVLYALEKDWFKMLADTKKPPRSSSGSADRFEFDFDLVGLIFSWPIMFGLFVILRIIIALSRV